MKRAEGTVLVVDDDGMNSEILKSMLNDMGVDAVTASNGEEALNICLKYNSGIQHDYQKLRLIFMDYSMPGMRGDEVARKLRKEEQYIEALGSNIPIIGLTAHIDAQTVQSCMSAGMDSVEAKPFSFERIKEILTSYKIISWF